MSDGTERIETVVIGGGQAGLAAAYFLKRAGRPFALLESNERLGDNWRSRWDSLHLFTPARHDGLPGLAFPAPSWSFPSKDQMGDYLEAYAERFALPVRTGVRVDGMTQHDGRYVVSAGDLRFEADNVVVASGAFQAPVVPGFASELDPSIVQLHSSEYRNQSQLQPGGVLVVGAGNSGAEVALESVRTHPTWMSGPDPGHIPFHIEGLASRILLERLVLRFVFYRVLTTSTPIGRKMRPKILSRGSPLIRIKPKELGDAGVDRVPRVDRVVDGRPVLEDGRTLDDVTNVVWCTGFRSEFSWIDLPALPDGVPDHRRGIVKDAPGLYFVGLKFLYAMASEMIHGVGRDAEYVTDHLVARAQGRHPVAGAPKAA
jgi:putative flavoprotein involved in K+ transport